MERQALEALSRDELVAMAERFGVQRPRVLTHPELVDELLKRTAQGERERTRARGWFGRARDLVAGVIERGLHLPDVARALRATPASRAWPAPPPPLPTVTLAEIYAAQGHLDRAVGVLDDVLAREPDHAEARRLRERFLEQAERARARALAASTDATRSARSADPPAGAATQRSAVVATSAPSSSPLSSRSSITASAAPSTEETIVAAAGGVAAAAHTEAPAPSPAAVRPLEPPAEPEASPADSRSEPPVPPPPSPAGTTAQARAPEEPPLPERYDVDEVVGIAVDPTRAYLYWEVRPATLAHLRARRPQGALVVRLVEVAPTWDGPATRVRDLRADALYGDGFVRDLEPGSHVRVSIGWLSASAFDPIAVGVELTMPRLTPADLLARHHAHWRPEPTAPGSGPEPTTRKLVGRGARANDRFWPAAAAARSDSEVFASTERRSAPPRSDALASAIAGPTRAWVRAIGASEHVREDGTERWRRGGASDLARGGASERSHGGASELGRSDALRRRTG